ncbi:uncharacterized protein A4U43_C07F27640 [Asparagus officinalis]|uniref:Uncharacterized protein n=1 Tax=Asparagus officinalis TaxID=4686 RepID=A0A5P1EFD3_ASPOF|nr:uncharacterized protein A4U43_C07F27640 [Asparagus officinalis]
MEPWHFTTYADSVFRHYVYIGLPGVDLPTFDHILSQWDEKRKKFVFTDRNAGKRSPAHSTLKIATIREDIKREIKPLEGVPPTAPNTTTDDEDAPLIFSRALKKRKRGVKGAHAFVSAAAPLKKKRCRREVKPSKWVVTPYTEKKKKKEKDNIGDKAIVEVAGEEEEHVQEKLAELAPARLQSDPHSIWENT